MIEINNLTKERINRNFIEKVGGLVLKGEGAGKENLSLVLVEESKMRELNKKYRKKDKATDILSFGEITDEVKELVICPKIVEKNAKKFGTSYNKELARVLIHGILHILGYKHEKSKKEAKKMEKRQEYYLTKINF